MNLPNKLTTLRVIMIPFFVACLLYQGGTNRTIRIAAAVIFILASLTDLLDGKIARKYNLVTNFGKFMDPLADKLLVCLKRVQAQPANPAGQSTPPVRAEESPMGSSAPCLGCCLRKDSPAPKARLQPGSTRRASPQSCAALWAAGGSMGSDAFYNARGLLWEIPRRRRA